MTDRIYTSAKEIERARVLWEKAVLLAERTEGFTKTRLYQLHDIYVEVTFQLPTNVVMQVSTFTDTERLECYLENISLEDLLS